jgi:ankyrin repeat protein
MLEYKWVQKKKKKKAETAWLLIKHRADVTARDESYSTPLHLASSFGVPEIVQLLIEHGADVTTQDGSRRTPLHLASSLTSFVSAQLNSVLFYLRPDVNGQASSTEFEMKPIVARVLIDCGSDVTAKDETHATPLHLAAFWGSAEIVQLLIEHGADVAAQDRHKRTPLHFALSKVSYSTILFLI